MWNNVIGICIFWDEESMTIYYIKLHEDRIMRYWENGQTVSSCKYLKKVPNIFGIIPDGIVCSTGQHAELIRVDS